MSNFNPSSNPQFSSDNISIDETGKVLINDAELAKMTEELSLEDLDYVTGGTDGSIGTGESNAEIAVNLGNCSCK
jgi:hypothetical protein